MSELFSDPLALLAECETRMLEGIVSKRADSRYRSGAQSQWIKVKTQTWRAKHRDRYKLFMK